MTGLAINSRQEKDISSMYPITLVTQSGLAAVYAAVDGPWDHGHSTAAPGSGSMAHPKPAPAAAAPAQIPSPVVPMTEADRLAGIDTMALPGCEAAVALCKADALVTPAMAASRILAAYKTSGAASKQINAELPSSSAPLTIEGWKAEFVASPELQAEFRSADAYAHYQQGVAAGRIRIHGASANPAARAAGQAAQVNMALLPEVARKEWAQSPELQAEFRDVDTYVAWRRAEALGRVRIYGAGARER